MVWLLWVVLALQGDLTARLEAETLEPLVGERVGVMLVVETPPGYTVTFPPLEEWGAFGVVDVQDPIIETVEGRMVHSQVFNIIPWQTGVLFSPQLYVTYQVIDGAERGELAVEPIQMRVQESLESDPTLRTSRETIDLQVTRLWLYVVWVILGVVGVLGGGYMLKGRIHGWGGRQVRGNGFQKTLGQSTMQQLYRLRIDAPDVIAQYAGTGDILREYVRVRFAVAVDDLTTDELVDALRQTGQLRVVRLKELVYLLDQADLAKFAPASFYSPSGQTSLPHLAQQWVKEVEAEVGV